MPDRSGQQEFPQRQIFGPRPLHAEIEVGPVKAGDHHLRVPEPEEGDDILPDLPGGGGGEGPHGRTAGQAVDKIRDLQIAWPKVLSPL